MFWWFVMMLDQPWNRSISWTIKFRNLWDLEILWYILENQYLGIPPQHTDAHSKNGYNLPKRFRCFWGSFDAVLRGQKKAKRESYIVLGGGSLDEKGECLRLNNGVKHVTKSENHENRCFSTFGQLKSSIISAESIGRYVWTSSNEYNYALSFKMKPQTPPDPPRPPQTPSVSEVIYVV